MNDQQARPIAKSTPFPDDRLGKYKHTKTGNYYVVLDVVTDATNAHAGDDVVFYVSCVTGRKFARRASEFFGIVPGVEQFRFVKCREEG